MVVEGGESKSGRISKLGKIKFPPRVDNAPRRGRVWRKKNAWEESMRGIEQCSREKIFLIKFIETPFDDNK